MRGFRGWELWRLTRSLASCWISNDVNFKFSLDGMIFRKNLINGIESLYFIVFYRCFCALLFTGFVVT